VILDAGFLVSVDRAELSSKTFLRVAERSRLPLRTTHPVVAQVWRNGATQARLARFLRSVTICPFDDGIVVGRLLAAAGSSDVIDAHLVTTAMRFDDEILTGDVGDIERLAAVLTGAGPRVHAWP
jgi:hypothetical protein